MLSSLLPPYSPNVWKAIIYGSLGLVVLGAVLFMFDCGSGYFTNRKIDQHKANINALASNIEKMETGVIPATKEEVAAQKMAANLETKALLENVNATDAAKEETNAALVKLEAAKNANTVNSSVRDLEEALKRLE